MTDQPRCGGSGECKYCGGSGELHDYHKGAFPCHYCTGTPTDTQPSEGPTTFATAAIIDGEGVGPWVQHSDYVAGLERVEGERDRYKDALIRILGAYDDHGMVDIARTALSPRDKGEDE